jgi:hypothetical protein
MRRRVAGRSDLVVARGKNTTTLVEHECTNGDVPIGERVLRTAQSRIHRSLVV